MHRNRLFLIVMLCLFQVGYLFTLVVSAAHLSRVFALYASGMSPLASVGVAAAVEINACLFSIHTAALGKHGGREVVWGSALAMVLVYGGNLWSMWLSAPHQPLGITILFATFVLIGTFFSPKASGKLLALLADLPPKSGAPRVEVWPLTPLVAPQLTVVRGGQGEPRGPRADLTPTAVGAPHQAGVVESRAPQGPTAKREGVPTPADPSSETPPVKTPMADPQQQHGPAQPDVKGPPISVDGVRDLTDAALERVGLTRPELEELAVIVKAAQRGTAPSLTAEQRVLAAYYWPRCHQPSLVRELGKDRTTIINAVDKVEAALTAAGRVTPTGVSKVVP